MLLQDKTILITGASSGIGAAAARLFASEGATLVLGARRDAKLRALAEEITSTGGQVRVRAGDVRDADYAAALVADAITEFGGLDGAFNNAGMMGQTSQVTEMALDTWDAVMATNLTGSFLAAKHQLPALKLRGGAIVFTGSFVGYSNGGLSGMAAYAASKAGLLGLVKSLAAEHASDGVRVNALLPGGTITEMAGDDPEVHSYISGLHPIGRMAAPGEIAQAAAFLLSDRASFVTGSALLADGGVSVGFG